MPGSSSVSISSFLLHSVPLQADSVALTPASSLFDSWTNHAPLPFIQQVKIITRRAFDQHKLSGKQLVRLMHGIARMPRYAPNTGWLQALTRQVQRDISRVTPGGHQQGDNADQQRQQRQEYLPLELCCAV